MDAAERRLAALALAAGLAVYGLLAVGVYLGGSSAQPFGVLAIVVPVVLGFSFGARAGALGASLPLLLLLPVELVRRQSDTTSSVSFTTETIYVLFVAVVLGFVAWFCGSIRDRYLVGRSR